MTKGNITHRQKLLAFAGGLAALLALGAAGAGVAGDPSQWVAVAGDPSQWGLVGPTAVSDTQASLNDNNIQLLSLNFTKIA